LDVDILAGAQPTTSWDGFIDVPLPTIETQPPTPTLACVALARCLVELGLANANELELLSLPQRVATALPLAALHMAIRSFGEAPQGWKEALHTTRRELLADVPEANCALPALARGLRDIFGGSGGHSVILRKWRTRVARWPAPAWISILPTFKFPDCVVGLSTPKRGRSLTRQESGEKAAAAKRRPHVLLHTSTVFHSIERQQWLRSFA
jgi:hypothetical protein